MSAPEIFFPGKKVLITGGLGFLGSSLAYALSELSTQVTIVDSLLKGHGGNFYNIEGIKNKVRFIRGDIRNAALMKKIVKDQNVLFNIAAQTSHTNSMANPFLDTDINTKGQIALLEACKEKNPSIRIVFCSTRAVYGRPNDRRASEESTPNPMDIYAVHKLAGEMYHQIYGTVHGLNTTILRVANGYGPRAQMKEPSFGILNWFMRLAIDGQPIKIFGDGKQVRDYIFIDDIVESFLTTAAHNDLKGEVLNVGSGRGIPLIEIVRKVVQITGRGKIVHVPWPETNQRIDVGDFIADIHKIRKKISWKPKIDLDSGLKTTIEFYKQNKSHYW